MTSTEILAIVLTCMSQSNLARRADQQLDVSPDALLFAPGTPLDSLGLVSLLIDVEEAMQAAGHDITVSDAKAMSQTDSPFYSVRALVAFLHSRVGDDS